MIAVSLIFHLIDFILLILMHYGKIEENSLLTIVIELSRFPILCLLLVYAGWIYGKRLGKNLLESALVGVIVGFIVSIADILLTFVEGILVAGLLIQSTPFLDSSNPTFLSTMVGLIFGLMIGAVFLVIIGIFTGAVLCLIGSYAAGVRKIDD